MRSAISHNLSFYFHTSFLAVILTQPSNLNRHRLTDIVNFGGFHIHITIRSTAPIKFAFCSE